MNVYMCLFVSYNMQQIRFSMVSQHDLKIFQGAFCLCKWKKRNRGLSYKGVNMVSVTHL